MIFHHVINRLVSAVSLYDGKQLIELGAPILFPDYLNEINCNLQQVEMKLVFSSPKWSGMEGKNSRNKRADPYKPASPRFIQAGG
jgi:hypothetical protein